MDKDVAQFRFLSDNERYADLINGTVFGGRQVVRGADLQEVDSQAGFWRTQSGRKRRKAGKYFGSEAGL